MQNKRIWRKVRRIALCIFAALILYLAVGAVAPFIKVKEVEDTGRADETVNRVMTARQSPDRAMILETNLSALEERIRLINQAKETIIMSTFDMREGESTSDILAMLYQKAEEGVQIQILVDGVSGLIRMRGVPLFQAVAAHKNIQIRIYNELNPLLPWKSMGRMHDKYLIIDKMAYILGGRNTFDYFIGEYPTDGMSFDREALIYNTQPENKESSVYEIISYFEEMWNYKECGDYDETGISEQEKEEYRSFFKTRYVGLKEKYPSLFEPFDYQAVTHETEGVTLLANEKHIYAKEPVVYYELTELMKRAKEQVIVHTPYAVMDKSMLAAMSEICQKVPVTMMVNARENGDNVMASSDYTWHRDDILDTGVSLLEYMGGTSYHGKSLVIDGNIAVIGSYNMDMRSTYVDTELMLAIRSKAVAEELTGYMQNLHTQCREVHAGGSEVMPEHTANQELSAGKRALFRGLGFVLQMFRVLI